MLRVTLIAKTEVMKESFGILDICDTGVYFASDGEQLTELSGRACYQSFHRPNPETASTSDYIKKNILGKGHESVLEHASVSFYVTGMSRACGYELLRHRHLSRSELSQRYVNMEEAQFVKPPLITDIERQLVDGFEIGWSEDYFQGSEFFTDVKEAYVDMDDVIDYGIEKGYREVSKKERREVQRSVLPNSTETRMVISGNLRAWRHVVKMRGALDADAEIREFAVVVFKILSADSPSIWSDMMLLESDDGRVYVGPVQ